MKTNELSKRMIKANLALQGKTLSGLASELGITRQALHQIITGYRSTPKRREQIAVATGLKVLDLWPDNLV